MTDLAHWQGTVDERLRQHEEHLRQINGSVERSAVRLEDLPVIKENQNSIRSSIAAVRNAFYTLIVVVIGAGVTAFFSN